ncbi:MAG: hypothetical protein LBF88_00070 [Planctomycetaceae bacterium]|nr:hypothetical protein [Planctomycetaceae bacterium]
MSILFTIILLSRIVSTGFTQNKTVISRPDSTVTNNKEDADGTKISTASFKSKNHYFWITGGIVIAVIICIIIYYYLKCADKKMTKIFQETIIEDIVSGLISSVSLNKNELKTIIHNLIINNNPLPLSLSLKNLLRIEYQLEKTSPDIVVRTVIIAIEKEGNVVLKKITCELSWDDLPSKIRHSFITEQKSNLFYSLYPVSEVNNDITG